MLSKEAWEAVQRNLMAGVGATLLVDGIEIRFKIARLKNEMRLVIIPAEDYATLEKWHSEDCPQRRLFFRRVTTSAWISGIFTRMCTGTAATTTNFTTARLYTDTICLPILTGIT